MKNPLHYITLLCFAMLMVSCQKEPVTDEVTLPNSTVDAQERCILRCDDCPVMTHCCCEVRIINFQTSDDLRFCGDFYDCGTMNTPPCIVSGTIVCPAIDGVYFEDVIMSDDTILICIPQDEAFIIRNLSTTPMNTVSLEIECQQSAGPPTVIPIDLDPGEFAVIDLDGNCIPDQCN